MNPVNALVLSSFTFAVAFTLPTTTAYAADPTTADCLAASETSLQLRSQNRFREARAQLLTCAAEHCPVDVRDECQRRVTEINASMPTIVIEAKDSVGRDLTDVQVSMDGQPLAERLAGSALSIDPGEHTFELRAAGQSAEQRKLVISEGVKGRRELVIFGGSSPQSETPSGAMGSNNAGVNPASDAPVAASDPGATWRIIGWSAVVGGGAGLALGAAFVLQRSSKLESRDTVCPSRQNCSTAEVRRNNDLTGEARAASTASAVSLIAGGLLLSGGVVAVLTAPRAHGASVGRTHPWNLAPVISSAFQGAVVSGDLW